MTIAHQKQLKAIADRLAREQIQRLRSSTASCATCGGSDESVRYTRARANRKRAIKRVLAIFGGCAAAGDTTGNSPGTKWTAFNAIAEHLDYGRRYTPRTNQVQRSFEDTSRKQRALDLVAAA